MSKRNDPHSPSNFVPEDYDFFACGSFGGADEPGYSPLNTEMGRKLLANGWRFADVESAGCQHCGARLRYYALMLHRPSHTILRVGEQCLDNRFDLASAEFHRLRREGKLNRDRMRKDEKRSKFLSNPSNAEAVEFAEQTVAEFVAAFEKRNGYAPDPDFDDMRWASFPAKLLETLRRYGDLTERQVDALLASKVRKAERDAKRAAEAAALAQGDAEPAPSGKACVTGEVLSVKFHENGYGGALKMRVRDDRGFSVWSTVPAAIEHVPFYGTAGDPTRVQLPVGSRVRFTATLTPADNDPLFAFAKRPTKAEVL